MKQLVLIAAVMIMIPFGVLAHGSVSTTEKESNIEGDMMMQDGLDHEEMETLMKKFLTKGVLSEEDADSMLVHMNNLMGSKMDGDMLENGMSDQGHHSGSMSDEKDDMMGGDMMGGGVMWMNMLHGLIAVTSIVWLIAGVLYLYRQLRRSDVVSDSE